MRFIAGLSQVTNNQQTNKSVRKKRCITNLHLQAIYVRLYIHTYICTYAGPQVLSSDKTSESAAIFVIFASSTTVFKSDAEQYTNLTK